MLNWLKKLLGHKDSSARYDAEKMIAQSSDTVERLKLAKNAKTSKDILFYMAQMDTDVNVRQAVATNKTTPVQASALLAKDKSADVRLALAQRLMVLLPDLSIDKQSQLYTYAVEALGNLALDEVLKIRVALSSTLKDMTDTPPSVAGRLARDLEREVSEPILRFCVALSDADLLDILRGHPASWVVQAVAARPVVTKPVSKAVIDTKDSLAGVLLMNNKGADISLETLKDIVEQSKMHPEWQKPIAMQKNISADMAKELASFVGQSVKNILLERTEFGADVMADIASIVQRRMDLIEKSSDNPAGRVQVLLAAGGLNDEIICDALSVRDVEFTLFALAALLKSSREKVDSIFAMKAAKSIVVLCWKAGLSMRTALRFQQEVAKIPHQELIYPKGGTDYPLSEEEICWQLEYLGFIRHKP